MAGLLLSYGFFEHAPTPIVALNREKEVAFRNPAAERLFGWTEEEILGKPYPLVPAGQESDFQARWVEMLGGRQFNGIEVLRRCRGGPDGSIALSSSCLRDEQGRIIGVIGFMEDISERKRAEDVVQETLDR